MQTNALKKRSAGRTGAPILFMNIAMSLPAILCLLGVAALLEAGGDALARAGLMSGGTHRALWFVAAAAVLFVYGLTVNLPPWNFGRLLGVYVVLFFLAAQAINAVIFKIYPSPAILAGGACIVAGGLIMTFWRA
jgi:small multidrug resistance family-3 protein